MDFHIVTLYRDVRRGLSAVWRVCLAVRRPSDRPARGPRSVRACANQLAAWLRQWWLWWRQLGPMAASRGVAKYSHCSHGLLSATVVYGIKLSLNEVLNEEGPVVVHVIR